MIKKNVKIKLRTLSGLLFQINLKHLLSISFLYFFGTTQALATYVNIGTIKDLIIKIFPKIVKFLFVHKSNKLFIFSILFSQLNFHILLYRVFRPVSLIMGGYLKCLETPEGTVKGVPCRPSCLCYQ
jgi:hypothetical protein